MSTLFKTVVILVVVVVSGCAGLGNVVDTDAGVVSINYHFEPVVKLV